MAAYYSFSDLIRQDFLSLNLSDPGEVGRLLYHSDAASRPWQGLVDQMVSLARRHKQPYITLWYPQHFGQLNITEVPETEQILEELSALVLTSPEDEPEELTLAKKEEIKAIQASKFLRLNKVASRNFLYTTLVQEFLPTRTGMDALKDSSSVWLTKVNGVNSWKVDRTLQEEW